MIANRFLSFVGLYMKRHAIVSRNGGCSNCLPLCVPFTSVAVSVTATRCMFIAAMYATSDRQYTTTATHSGSWCTCDKCPQSPIIISGTKNPFLCPDRRVATGEGRLAQWGRTKFVPSGRGEGKEGMGKEKEKGKKEGKEEEEGQLASHTIFRPCIIFFYNGRLLRLRLVVERSDAPGASRL